MPDGKPAGVRCIQLDDNNRCRLFGSAQRPAVCRNLQPNPDFCGDHAADAMNRIQVMELATKA